MYFFEPPSVVAVAVSAATVTRIKRNRLREMKLNPHQSRAQEKSCSPQSSSIPTWQRSWRNIFAGTNFLGLWLSLCKVKLYVNTKTKPVKITGAATQTSPAINSFPHSHIHLPSLPYASHFSPVRTHSILTHLPRSMRTCFGASLSCVPACASSFCANKPLRSRRARRAGRREAQ